MMIFAVDDKRIELNTLAAAIRRAEPKADIRAFRGGMDALKSEENCDVAFIDIEMPVMNGILLAKKLKAKNPKTNIVFATACDSYMSDAFSLHASGYITKPITAEKIRGELDNLRYPIENIHTKRVVVHTFGNFEVFADEKPVIFRHERTKELFAYLIDRGTLCSNNEIISRVWDNNISQSYFRQLSRDLIETFEALGIGDVIIRHRGMRGVNKDAIQCDFYDWQAGVPEALNNYRGEYMAQYSWAEFTHGTIK